MSRNIILFDPSIGSMNIGDRIIFNSIGGYVDALFPDANCIRLPTQTPVSDRVLKWYRDADYRFVCGTNLLKNSMLYEKGRFLPHFKNTRQWDITLSGAKYAAPAVLFGCGWQRYQAGRDRYSARLWNRLLHKDLLHSVRDGYTQEKLAEIGVTNTVNTGCPTMWGFTEEHCSRIPKEKAESVVTTVTDYSKDADRDQSMLDILSKNYSKVYLWPQGYYDIDYIKRLRLPGNADVLPQRLDRYEALLSGAESVEYVGTRLHGGVRALQLMRRALIIAVDNRATELGKNFGLDILQRCRIHDLDDYINAPRGCSVTLPDDNIRRFMEQFG